MYEINKSIFSHLLEEFDGFFYYYCKQGRQERRILLRQYVENA